MTKPGRIPCLNPRCRRTADAAKYPPRTEIICGKCWKRVPPTLKNRQKRQRALIRKAERKQQRLRNGPSYEVAILKRLRDRHSETWDKIRAYFAEPSGEPEGLSQFLKESGL